MKKILLSVFVIISFVLYSFGQRHTQTNTVITAPATTGKSLTTNTITATTHSPTAKASTTVYKDGSYTGTAADALYGNIQVKASIKDGKITAVEFLQYPNDRRLSVQINQQAMPYLQQEAIKAQSAHVNGVSGATDTSQAFVQSLSSALSQAS